MRNNTNDIVNFSKKLKALKEGEACLKKFSSHLNKCVFIPNSDFSEDSLGKIAHESGEDQTVKKDNSDELAKDYKPIYGNLHEASLANMVDDIKYFLNSDQAPLKHEILGESLYIAIKSGRLDSIKLIVEKIPDINVNFDWRSKKKHEMRFLESSKSSRMEIEVEDLYYSNQPIILLAAYIGVHEIFRILIQKKNVNVNLQNECGHTALMAASFYGRCRIVKLLADNNAYLNIQDKEGRTAL